MASTILLGLLSSCGGDEVPAPAETTLVTFPNSSATCEITAGELRCWGFNDKGLLGYGHTNSVGDDEDPCGLGPVPLGGESVRGLFRIGGASRCAITDTGRARCWGSSFAGEVLTDPNEPAEAGPRLAAEVELLQLVGGSEHACALLAGGSVRCWGQSDLLGQGDGLDRALELGPSGEGDLSELPDVPLGGPARTLVAGSSGAGSFTCALLEAGAVRCWGTEPTLGYGDAQVVGDDETPEQVGDVPLGGPATSLVAGRGALCAGLDDGSLRCWGRAAPYGVLGYGDIFADTDMVGDDETPEQMGPIEIGEAVEAVYMGDNRTCVLLEGGRVRCWGDGLPGVLGYGPEVTRLYSPPPDDIELGGPVRDLALGRNHGCAVLEAGGIRCWGHNSKGQLGLGDTSSIGVEGLPADVPIRPSCEGS
ncbi:hypothetical protein ENSA5_33260 [Enhygromyxa salina]|uniref:Regulator of chromosome condensation (RCC1) repeat protein n=1 Tax=Enhygromyxa salina TaxID=215803 RepID=A0A2S9XXD3_9BACT|nr:hypothetical protein ENSA5_33260 [Enhygromyxa salina]